MPDDDHGPDGTRLRILHRIADALEVPASALAAPDPVRPGGAGAISPREVAAMLTVFMRIRDPEQRRACLDHVIAVANDGERPTDG